MQLPFAGDMYTNQHTRTHAHCQWPSGRPVVQLVMFPCSGDEHLLFCCIALSSFNKITFTIFPAHIIYLFVPPYLICAIRTPVQSVKWDGVQGRRGGAQRSLSGAIFCALMMKSNLRTHHRRVAGGDDRLPATQRNHIIGEQLLWWIDWQLLIPLKHFNFSDMKDGRLVTSPFAQSNADSL